jgi:hypothetical protein
MPLRPLSVKFRLAPDRQELAGSARRPEEGKRSTVVYLESLRRGELDTSV